MNDSRAPLTRDLLKLLAEAGEAGLTAGDLTDRFTGPEDKQRRNARIGQLLAYQLANGRVLRGDLEQTARYHRAWTRRWFITASGRAYLDVLDDGAAQSWHADIRGQLEVRTRERDFEQHRYAALHAVLTGPHPLTLPMAERNAKMLELREAGCALALIGAVFGVTRERVRQILNSLDTSQAGELDCGHGKHDIRTGLPHLLARAGTQPRGRA